MKSPALPFLVGALAIAFLDAGCGKAPPPTPDAGPDTSCGIDCEAQQRYGLILNRCFEYTDTTAAQTPPALGVLVTEKRTLEGDVPVISVDYSQSGARKMTDSFMLTGGKLVLARREWVSGGSVTYKDPDGNITGVDLWQPGTAVNENFSTQSSADFITPGGMRQTDDTSFTVVTSAPAATDKTVPLGTFDNAIRLVVNEQPSHAFDSRRIFVEGTGFTVISTSLSSTASGGTPYLLQAIRDIGTPDGGTTPCGLAP